MPNKKKQEYDIDERSFVINPDEYGDNTFSDAQPIKFSGIGRIYLDEGKYFISVEDINIISGKINNKEERKLMPNVSA